jgi:hypothetical protein
MLHHLHHLHTILPVPPYLWKLRGYNYKDGSEYFPDLNEERLIAWHHRSLTSCLIVYSLITRAVTKHFLPPPPLCYRLDYCALFVGNQEERAH